MASLQVNLSTGEVGMAGGGGFFSSNVAFSGVQIADANGDLTNLTANTIFASNLNVIGDFVTMNTITSNTERVDISNSGTGPALKVTQGVGIAAETALTVNQESSGNILQLQQSGVTKVSVQENGFVGIGTTAPQSALDVIGSIKATTSIMSDTQFLGQANDAASAPSFSFTANPNTGIFQPATHNLALSTGGIEHLRVSSNGFVGIGTTNPQNKLDVVGKIKATTSIMSDTQFLGQAADTASAPSFSFISNQDTGIFQPAISNIALSTAGTERLRVSSNGFVGIGTSSPTSALDVIGSASISSNLVVSGNITASNIRVLGDYVILDTITSNTEQMVITNDGTGPALKVTQTGVNSIAEFYDDENALAFKVANDGLVGIGTANPLAKLHVVGSIKATTSISSDTQFLGKALDTEGAPSFSFTANPNTGIFQPATSNLAVSTGGTERLRVASNGNVGIGTMTPQNKLDVIGSIKATESILSDTQFLGQANDTASAPSFSFVANPDTGIFQPAVSNIALSTGGTERLRVSSNGNVGIGTTTPQTALDVIGSTSISSNLVVSGNITASNIRVLGDYVILDTITSNTEQMVITNDGTGPALKVTQTGMNSIAEFYDDDNALALKVANNGLVGIGTADPLEKLHVIGSIRATTSIMSDTQFLGQASDTASSPSFSFTANPNTGIFQPATSNLAVSTGGTERLRVSSNGNVGIGTVTPQNKLDVIGSIKATASISSDTQFLGQAGDTAGTPSFSFAANPNTGIFQPLASNIALSTGGTERLRVSSNGFVGIGTVDPQSALHVIGSTSISSNLVVSGNITASNIRVLGDYVILDTITSNTEQMVITNDGTGPALKVTQTGANSIAEFYDDGNVLALKVANNGLVGIGTANPQDTLQVTGTLSVYNSNTLVFDPFKETILSSTYGNIVDISDDGNTVVVSGLYNSNTVNVFKKISTSWVLTIITGSNPSNKIGQNVKVSSNGNSIVTGPSYPYVNGTIPTTTGYFIVLKFNGSSWVETVVTSSNSNSSDNFGSGPAVSSDGNTIVIGRSIMNNNKFYVFKFNGTVWIETVVTASVSSNISFGTFTISGDGTVIVIVSQYGSITIATPYVFKWNGTSWVEMMTLSPSSTTNLGYFANSVSISGNGDVIAFGNIIDNSAFLFRWNAGTNTWLEEAKITPTGSTSNPYFGTSIDVSLDGNAVAVSADWEGRDGLLKVGAVYIFKWNGSAWIQTQKAIPAVSVENIQFGGYVAIASEGNRIVVSSGANSVYFYGPESTGSASMERLKIDTSGNVGIGTSNPQSTLHVQGTAQATTFSGSGSSLTTLNADNISTGTLAVARGGTGVATLTANKVLVGNGTTAVLQPTNLHWDNANSRLGIGITAPRAELDISGTGAMIIPSGTTVQQPTSPVTGMLRYNITTNKLEFYSIFGWSSLGGISATGGNSVYDINGYRVHVFNSSATYTVYTGGVIEYLVVAGGGGGGTGDAGSGMGGGGAGGLVYNGIFTITSGAYVITIGGGGAAGIYSPISHSTNGNNTTAFGITCIGGGAGASTLSGIVNGSTGGSGGGGGGSGASPGGTGGLGTTNQGNRGGNGGNSGSSAGYKGGGGGGAGVRGQDIAEAASTTVGLNGGNGSQYTISGTNSYYAGGGGGGVIWNGWTSSMTGGTGGLGGGGKGGDAPISQVGTNGIAGTINTGGGGGAGAYVKNGGTGGSGVVIIRYLL